MADTLSMARNAKAGTTHYDTLGLSPTATTDEITNAFARHMNAITPRSVAMLARLSVAYKTLRDPEKRRAYDASLKPAPVRGYTFQWSSTPPPAQALVDRLTRPVAEQSTAVPEPQRPAPKPEMPVSQVPRPEIPPPLKPPEPKPSVARDFRSEMLVMEDYQPVRRPGNRYDQTAIDWKKVAVAVGWPILGIAMIGGIAGWAAGIAGRQSPPDALKVALPQAERALQQADSALIIPPPMEGEALPAPRRSANVPVTTRAPSVAANSEPLAPVDDVVREADAASTAAVVSETASANMPLSNATIARTIGRIGYACGQVASTTPVGSGGGVFKVTCTSGNAYQARPVGGRYRFKRWGGG